MITCYHLESTGLVARASSGGDLAAQALWFDLLEPTADEERLLERTLGVEVPTPEEMREIETSNRLYEENGCLYMTATVVTQLDTDRPTNSQITFILTGDKLVTNRYVNPLPFRRFIAYAARNPQSCKTAAAVLAGLLESIIDRIADVLERTSDDIDELSAEIFAQPADGGRRKALRDYRGILERVGRNGDLNSKARETLGSLGRLLVFLLQANHRQLDREVRERLRSVAHDVRQISDHAAFLANKLQFLLEATLGMVNIDQNNILKIFSVVTVVLLPPSVIGAIFGMNFEYIPSAAAPWGFALALALMAVSAVLPLWYFRRRGWL